MKVYSFKLNKTLALVSVAVFLAVTVIGTSYFAQTKETALLGGSAKQQSVRAVTNEERVGFLKGCGFEVEEEPAEIMEVLIPEEFDEVYEKYNELQKTHGMDLKKFKGKRVKRYTYRVTRYAGEEGEVRANLLIYEDKIIGGDVCSVELDGFMHGFNGPSPSGSPAPAEGRKQAA